VRVLNKKQKKIIESAVKEQGLNYDYCKVLKSCEDINDFETLHTDLRRYAEDYYWKLKDIEIEKFMIRG